jgi:hypothetical protein
VRAIGAAREIAEFEQGVLEQAFPASKRNHLPPGVMQNSP